MLTNRPRGQSENPGERHDRNHDRPSADSLSARTPVEAPHPAAITTSLESANPASASSSHMSQKASLRFITLRIANSACGNRPAAENAFSPPVGPIFAAGLPSVGVVDIDLVSRLGSSGNVSYVGQQACWSLPDGRTWLRVKLSRLRESWRPASAVRLVSHSMDSVIRLSFRGLMVARS
jgi:hypothetical protein